MSKENTNSLGDIKTIRELSELILSYLPPPSWLAALSHSFWGWREKEGGRKEGDKQQRKEST